MIIFLNGSINSGKSTVAKILREKIKKTVIIEADVFYYFIGSDEDIERIGIVNVIPIILKNAISSIRNFAEEGFNVVVPYPLSQRNYEYMSRELSGFSEQLYFFTLSPDIKKAQTSTDDREISQWEHDRIQHHYDIGIAKPSFGEVIDNTEQTPEETADEILSLLPQNF